MKSLICFAFATLPLAVTASNYVEKTSPFDGVTVVRSTVDAQRLLHNKGVTLQWIDWNTRGSAFVSRDGALWKLRAAQAQAGGPGRLFLDGKITEIGVGYFTFHGTIRITDTPDTGRIWALTHFCWWHGRLWPFNRRDQPCIVNFNARTWHRRASRLSRFTALRSNFR